MESSTEMMKPKARTQFNVGLQGQTYTCWSGAEPHTLNGPVARLCGSMQTDLRELTLVKVPTDGSSAFQH